MVQERKDEAIRRRTPNAKDTARMANTLRVLTLVARENADIEVVSHEATHHMAAVTGLFPNKAPVTTWAHEGPATYFESPRKLPGAGSGPSIRIDSDVTANSPPITSTPISVSSSPIASSPMPASPFPP